MAWAGTGVVFAASAGVVKSYALGPLGAGALPAAARGGAGGGFTIVQISDSHIGFDKEANRDVTATLQEAVAKINALPEPPDFLIHTGDLTHLSKPGEFDTLDQVLRGARAGEVFRVPGEHDVFADNGKQYLGRYGKGTHGNGWFSFDHKGVHFVGLVNGLDLKAGGLGSLGAEQLAWLERDLRTVGSSTPVVVCAHVPLWTVYPAWGWGTEDAGRALEHLRRFGSVTVLNGHIHQVMQKVEGRVAFHTAASTAFPQPQPGAAPGPGPMKVPEGRLRELLGVTDVTYVQGRKALAVVDSSLASRAWPEAEASPSARRANG